MKNPCKFELNWFYCSRYNSAAKHAQLVGRSTAQLLQLLVDQLGKNFLKNCPILYDYYKLRSKKGKWNKFVHYPKNEVLYTWLLSVLKISNKIHMYDFKFTFYTIISLSNTWGESKSPRMLQFLSTAVHVITSFSASITKAGWDV